MLFQNSVKSGFFLEPLEKFRADIKRSSLTGPICLQKHGMNAIHNPEKKLPQSRLDLKSLLTPSRRTSSMNWEEPENDLSAEGRYIVSHHASLGLGNLSSFSKIHKVTQFFLLQNVLFDGWDGLDGWTMTKSVLNFFHFKIY